MHRSISPAFIILILLFVSATGCATITPAPAVTSSPSDEWKTYTSSEYGFSISYPAYLEIIPAENNASLYIGEQIHVWISDVNPLECRGDCPLVERSEPATVAGLAATKVTGYIGSIGGNIPQRYTRYILQQDGRYYIFTLYALSFKATSNDPARIWPLSENDVALFEQVLETFKFTN